MPRIYKTVQSQPKPERLLNVAAYARVSSGKDAMFRSLSAQVSFYSSMIQNHKGWNYVGVYSDEAITGTKETRESFQRLLNDCRNSKIDLVITKSISRFARNTVDSLVTIRKLKEHNVEVYFERENIYTFDGKGELLLTIMSSLAQEESRSISQNVTWGQRKRFADGKVSLPYKHFLGYEKGEDGIPKIVPEQAEIVRTIYRQYMLGKSITAICRYLESKAIKTPQAKRNGENQPYSAFYRMKNTRVTHCCKRNLRLIFCKRKRRKTKAKFHSIMWRGVMNR